MTTHVGHGRRGRRAGAKRRTPRAAIAAGALAAASIPLWPSAAGAEGMEEYKTESRTVTVAGVSCPITMSSYRANVFVSAKIQISSDRSECTNVSWDLSVLYTALGGQRAQAVAAGRGPEAEVIAVYAEDLLHTDHSVAFDASGGLGWRLTLHHPNPK